MLECILEHYMEMYLVKVSSCEHGNEYNDRVADLLLKFLFKTKTKFNRHHTLWIIPKKYHTKEDIDG